MSEFSAAVYRVIFAVAAMYNVAFGLWAAFAPRAFFDLFHLDAPRYPAIWACLGMVVGLYGAGYAYAAWRIDRAAPFIAIGLAGKVLGPIGWLIAVRSHELPFRTFPLIVFDDLMWWLPFALFFIEPATLLRRAAPYWCAGVHVITTTRHERLASLLTGGAANALYTLAGVTLTIVTIADSKTGVMISSATLMILFVPFVVAMGVTR